MNTAKKPVVAQPKQSPAVPWRDALDVDARREIEDAERRIALTGSNVGLQAVIVKMARLLDERNKS